ncbi:SUMO-activating enzyme subunit 2-B [Chironomus tepperi]|uniref:SUMO-activating enzyme subunit 2-B n=1 Tax=Chironomus tepperi TaxID=113505 RepID=UPI00391F4362
MAAEIEGFFKNDLRDKITASKLLVVGAGGIGCEILKNLVMSGFKDIEIIDLDTIDVSNLNRQFLFHKEHVGKAKAVVARETALKFNPNVEIKAYHDSIFSTDYGVSFFQRFTMVLNALDNRAARNHVNRMCLNAKIPLIESGTAGYNGQVELIERGVSQCYECTPKAAQKTFPGCTIRNTPSEPIHCIVWAKHLFNQLFGEDNADEDVSPDTADPEASGEAGKGALDSESNEKGNVERTSTKQWAKNCDFLPEKLFNKFFNDDINYLLSMSNLWKNRTPPKPMKFGEHDDVITEMGDVAPSAGVVRDQKVWTVSECQQVFAESVNNLKEQVLKLKEDDNLVWDKDDKDAMDFVTACANIRSTIFTIPRKSRFDIKSMAGNIIPAIASTNAITAGFVVLHAFKVLEKKFDQCQSVYVRAQPNARNQIFVPEKLITPPNPNCYVCAAKPELVLKIDTEKVTVKELRDDILIKEMHMVNPDVMLDGKGIIVISSDDDETECNEAKLLKEMHIVDGCILKVDDFFQNYELTITIIHKTAERDDPKFEIVADKDVLKTAESVEEVKKQKEEESLSQPQPGPSNGASSSNGAKAYESDEDDLIVVEPHAEKRKHAEEGEDESPTSKRVRVEEPAASSSQASTVEGDIDDDEDLICIDDD